MDQNVRKMIYGLPKIELHRHLEGAVRLTSLLEIAQESDDELREMTLERLRPYVQMIPGQPHTAQQFLSKFHVLRQFYRSEEVIKRLTREVVIDAANDNVRYMELRFTPKALSNVVECSFYDVAAWVCEAVSDVTATHDIMVKLLVSMNRHEGVRLGEEIIDVALALKLHGVVGIDLAGQEQGYSCKPFAKVFERAREEGLRVCVHAGEWDGPQSVREAVEYLGAERVGHGVRALEDPDTIDLLLERDIALEVCPTSNVLSGVVADFASHPLPQMLERNMRTTINTDDPLICDISLSDEMVVAVEHLNLSVEVLKRQTMVAANAVFLPELEKMKLVARFGEWLS